MLEDVMSASPEAWLFTSRRGVEGWRHVWVNLSENEKPLRIPPAYAVGEGTGMAIREKFEVSDVRSTDEQHGKALAERLMDDGVRSAIHFCGAIRRTELRDVFRKNQVELIEVEVYHRTDIMKKDTEIEKVCNAGQVDAILFFSPDGVSGFYRLYALPDGDWTPLAIGPTTADAVRKVTGREPRIAPVPSFREMIRLV